MAKGDGSGEMGSDTPGRSSPLYVLLRLSFIHYPNTETSAYTNPIMNQTGTVADFLWYGSDYQQFRGQ